MPDRIKEIYQAARGISSMEDDFMEPWEFEYAKLIISECNKVIYDGSNPSIFYQHRILRHFGVKE